LPHARLVRILPRRLPETLLPISLTCLFLLAAVPSRGAELAIVVDDIGYSLERAERLVALPGTITFGMLPFAPHTPEIARSAAEHDKEVILHQPMQPLPTSASPTERGTLTLDMTPERFDQQFAAALANVPQAVGVNNHTGSLLTQYHAPMARLMDNIQRRGLFFLDSRTTPMTVAESTAREWQVPALRRDVFLDHDPSMAAIAAAFEHSLAIARRRGHAIVIAHPYRTSVSYLEGALAALPGDIRLVGLSELVMERGPRLTQPGRTTLARLESPENRSRSPGR